MASESKSNQVEDATVIEEIKQAFCSLEELHRKDFLEHVGITQSVGASLGESIEVLTTFIEHNQKKQDRDAFELRKILEELRKRSGSVQSTIPVKPRPQFRKPVARQGLRDVLELLFSPETPNLSLGLQKCMEHLSDPLVATLAGLCLIEGLGSIPNPKRAVEILTPHSSHPRAQAILAECYIFGKGVERDLDRGIELLESAYNAGDLYAYLVSGECAHLGALDVVRDTEHAFREYRWVTEDDHVDNPRHDTSLMKCLAKLRSAQASTGDMVLKYLREAATFTYPKAWYELGRRLLDDVKTDTDRETGMMEITRAADARYLPACLFMARGWRDSTGKQAHLFPEPNLQKALKYYLYAAEQGDLEFQNFAAQKQYELESTPSEDDFKQIVVTFSTKAEKQNDANAQVNLGMCYYFGYGVEQDHEQAFKWFEKSANQGNAFGQYGLGNCYYAGEGVAQDYKQAVEWFEKSAKRGHASAQNNLGRCYYNGEGVTQDYKQAVEWYLKSANQGNASGQISLGKCYYNGQGVEQDYKQAVEWYLKSAKQGHADAQFGLGNRYYYGKGVEQDYKQAFEWYLKSAKQGNADGQYGLGNCYYYGHGVPQDYKQAFDWYEKSAKQGDALAKYQLDECRKRLGNH